MRLTFTTAPQNVEADNQALRDLTEAGEITVWVNAPQAAALIRLADEGYAEKSTTVSHNVTCFRFVRTAKRPVAYAEGVRA